ncbi:MAG: dTDP-4-amino-4,6-dideoxygalactose transaminase [Firmicutes bacterium HGW-Firmicutes-14]|nr:MAG: dTDP-4-amino-4,6-dideoxygalactose transaminase [Firmicutes bacterium HGW-Firmicutes-14]
MKIPFNIPTLTGNEAKYVLEALNGGSLSGNGEFTRKCQDWLQDRFKCHRAYLTTSCTHALEMCALLADIKPGDEVIMPSYTFVSTANAFALRGGRIVFTDIRPDTMNIDEKRIEEAVTGRTRAIVPVHYAGVACEMDTIMKIAGRYDLIVIEDAAQGVMGTYKGRPLGTIGHLGCYSFHATKNINCGEGGALIVNDERFAERAEIIWEKGTDRMKFFRGEIDRYTWVDLGSSYLPDELNAAFLYAQLESAETINEDRLQTWDLYKEGLQSLAGRGALELPSVPRECGHNAGVFYVKTGDIEERTELVRYLGRHGVASAFHFVPLHSSTAGRQFGRFWGDDFYTTGESERLLRLPLYYGMEAETVNYVVRLIRSFYS